MADVAVISTAVVAAPKDYLIPGAQELIPKAVRAVFDGTGASGSFRPTLQLLAPNGTVMWESTPTASIAAGASADVSWFPGLAGSSGGNVQTLVGARIIQSSSQSIPNGTTTDMHYQTVDFDTAGMTNLASNDRILTATTGGLYMVIFEAGWPYESGSSGNRVAGVYQNSYGGSGGSQTTGDARMPVWSPIGGGGGGSPHTTNLTVGLVRAVAGDFFSSAVQQNSGASQTISDSSNSRLSAVLLGEI